MPSFRADDISIVMLVLVLVVITLTIGTIGYHMYAHLNWIDSFHNAALILPGCGLINQINSFTGKIFSACYAIVTGLVIIVIIAAVIGRIVNEPEEEN